MPPRRTVAPKLLLIGLGLGLGIWAVHSQFPAHKELFPKCLFYELTGLYCPGCGSTRALHALLCGNLGNALHNNALLVFTLPLLMAWMYQQARRWVWGTPLAAFWESNPLLPQLGCAVLVYFVLRNLPWWPFTILAPLPM